VPAPGRYLPGAPPGKVTRERPQFLGGDQADSPIRSSKTPRTRSVRILAWRGSRLAALRSPVIWCQLVRSSRENQARERALAAARAGQIPGVRGLPRAGGLVSRRPATRRPGAGRLHWLLILEPAVGGLPTARRRPPGPAVRKLPAWLTSLGTDWCFEFAGWLATDETLDDLIVMAAPDLGELVLLEGHARLTAVFVGGLQ
jgi:hypothetical protein